MSDFIPKPAEIKQRGLSPKAQKLLAAREKAANAKGDASPTAGSSTSSTKAKPLAGTKKTSFQRKAT